MTQTQLFKSFRLLRKRNNVLFYHNVYPFIVSSLLSTVLLFAFPGQKFSLKMREISLSFEITPFRAFAGCFALISALFLFALLCSLWSLEFKSFVMYQETKSVSNASHAFVEALPHCGSSEICPLSDLGQKTFFVFQKTKHFFDSSSGKFEPVAFPISMPIKRYLESKGLEDQDIPKIENLYGPNEFEIPDISFSKLFIEHISAPFFVFQLVVVVLWSLDGYIGYSLLIVAMLLLFEASMAYRRLKNLSDVRGMRFPSFPIYAFRNGKWTLIDSSRIFPGDILSFRAARSVGAPCDVVLLRGSAVVNEALLTGESTPQTKTAINSFDEVDQVLDLSAKHKSSAVNGGTFVLSASIGSPSEAVPPLVPDPPDGGALVYTLRTCLPSNQSFRNQPRTVASHHSPFDRKRFSRLRQRRAEVSSGSFECFCVLRSVRFQEEHRAAGHRRGRPLT
ncbi:putative cation-transporting ATPase 1 [Bonamia ostreae]|uniref:Cation-transporting ATPase 1 n=1 Tax=Bonamia ostreae TaxID=126728 RepID=A0ABV2AEL7_9EUKA